MKGFDLATAIKIFLCYRNCGPSEDLADFLSFIKKYGIKIRQGDERE